MLHIKPVNRYTIPKYPQGIYHTKPPSAVLALGRGAVTSAMLLLLLEACDGTGTTGPPPIVPQMVTESEARYIINRVFTANGVMVSPDVIRKFEKAPGDTVTLILDGYDNLVDVGYEYIQNNDYSVFTPEVVAVLDSVALESGPYIKSIHEIESSDSSAAILESMAREFIDALKAQGVI